MKASAAKLEDFERLMARFQRLTDVELEEQIDETESRLSLLRAVLRVRRPGDPAAPRRPLPGDDDAVRLRSILAFVTAYGPATTDTIRQHTRLDRDVIAGLLWQHDGVQRTASGHWRLG